MTQRIDATDVLAEADRKGRQRVRRSDFVSGRNHSARPLTIGPSLKLHIDKIAAEMAALEQEDAAE